MFNKLYIVLLLLVFNSYFYALSGRTITIYNQTIQDITLNFFDATCMYTDLSSPEAVSMDSLNNTILKANNSVKVHEESKASEICFFIRSNSSEYKLKASLSIAPYIYTVMKGEAYGSAIERFMNYSTVGGSIKRFTFSFKDNNIYIKH
ncbi:hypothetical protein PsalMR5_02893 [Piscirickettsia salmonis]|nr:hypothetical protein PsalSR1_02889 [Piscirickettsia salmonis]QGP58718.1 hypothetical protein PsalBI1_01298 [Piscirickettsia salmonis]QGP65012.1 hypothetical protein PsalMR5_02893 [Piscirickettsia salmonis]